jgi:hypothetical protein
MIVDTKLRIKFDITTLCLIGFIYCSIGEIYFACKSKERGHSLYSIFKKTSNLHRKQKTGYLCSTNLQKTGQSINLYIILLTFAAYL